jgi:hypothetical protein
MPLRRRQLRREPVGAEKVTLPIILRVGGAQQEARLTSPRADEPEGSAVSGFPLDSCESWLY